MKEKIIVNLICKKCEKLTLIQENVDKMKCFFCGSGEVETGWEYKK